MSSTSSDSDVVHIIQTQATATDNSGASSNNNNNNANIIITTTTNNRPEIKEVEMPFIANAGYPVDRVTSSHLQGAVLPLFNPHFHGGGHTHHGGRGRGSCSASQNLDQQFTVEEQVTTVHIPMRRPSWKFLEILQEGGARGEVFTMKEIVHHVKDYIIKRKLFDTFDPRVVHCAGDKMGQVFGVENFTINEAVPLFTKHSLPVPDSCIRIRRQLVRKAVESQTHAAAACTSTSSFQGEYSATSTVTSTTGSSEAATSGMTFVDSGDCASSAFTSTASRPSSHRQEAAHGSSSREGRRAYGVNIEYGDEVDGAVPVFVNLETNDRPLQLQTHEAPEEDSVSVQYDSDHFAVEYELEPSDPLSDSEHSSSNQDRPLSSSQEKQQSSSQEITGTSSSQDNRERGGGKWNSKRSGKTIVAPSQDVCVVCASRPKTGCIIHGSSGHQVCCYRCAKKLKRKNKPCPVCRRPIQKVIKNFVL